MAYDISTTYDAIGNLTSKSGVGSLHLRLERQRHRRGAAPGARGQWGEAYSYDANGNLISGRRSRNYTWTADNTAGEHHQRRRAAESYSYDADGERVVRTAGGVTTVYFAGLWEETTSGRRARCTTPSTARWWRCAAARA